MKKILSTVAALGLVAGMATAAQALEFSVSGHYFVEGVYQSSGWGGGVALVELDGNGDDADAAAQAAGVDTDAEAADAFWRHEFIIRPVMKVNDKIVVKSKIYLANDPVDTATTDGTWGAIDTSTTYGGSVNVHHLFMEYASPIGKVRVGRTSSGLWQGDFLSSDKNDNRLMYFPNFMPENFGACVFLQKSKEEDSLDFADQALDNDGDYDVYEASVWYKTKDMVAALAYDHFDDASTDTFDIVKHLVKGYYNQNFGNVYAETEFAYVWGDKDFDDDTVEDRDINNFAIMADVGMTMDKLDIGMLAFYATGDSDDTYDSDDTEALSAGGYGLGEQFQPYVILTGATTGMYVSDYNAADTDLLSLGIISLGMHADFAVTDKLNLHSAIAWAQLEDAESNMDKELGWEIDLGVSYNLMDNLTYSVDFGYFMTGEAFEGADVVDEYDTTDVYVLTHRLTMEF